MMPWLHGQVRGYLELEARLLGELAVAARYTTTNIILNPQFVELRLQIVHALREHPDARQAVVEVLHKIESIDADQLDDQAA